MPLEKCHKCGEVAEPVKEVIYWVMKCCDIEVKRFLFAEVIKQWNDEQFMKRRAI